MSAKKKKASIVVVQIVAIIVLVLAVLSTVATLMVRSATDTADQQQQVPSMLGKQFLPARDAKFEKINIQNGSLVLLKDLAESGVQTNDVVVFTTPAEFNDNAIYRTFSLGRISDMTTTGDIVQYSIEGLGDNGDVILESSAIVGIAGWQMPHFGTMVATAIGSGGIIYFIVVPFFLFLVLLLLIVILRTVFSSAKKQEYDDQERVDEVPQETIAEKKSEDQDHRYDRMKAKESEDTGAYVPQESLEPISLKFKRKEVRAAFQDVKSQTFTTIPPEDVPTFTKEEMQQLRPVAEITPIVTSATAIPLAVTVEEKPITSAVDVSEDIARILAESVQDTHKAVEPENPVFGLLDERRAPERSDEFRSVLEMVDGLLSDIKEEQKHSVFKMEQEATQEFRVDHVRERMKQADPLSQKNESFVQNAKSQEILDNILIELKDNALDVQFRNVKSKAVDIEKIPSGDGFTIDTPRYKANVKIEIDKK